MLDAFIIVLIACVLLSGAINVTEDAILRTPDLILKYGYPFESHRVVTEDGYILTQHRIPYGKYGPDYARQPIILQHGVLCSSSDWILTGPDRALAYILADNGFDVWLVNSRGNEYSTNHTKLNTKSSQYWDFSWHSFGYYDLPATIDYILTLTGHKNLIHIGHSQGTTSLYVLLAERPEYNNKILAHISYSPIVFRRNIESKQYKSLAAIESTYGIKIFNAIFGHFNLAPRPVANCNNIELCTKIYLNIMGDNRSQLDKSLLPLFFGHFPAGSSIKQFVHSVQLVNSGKFAKYDYKILQNKRIYNRNDPPEYNLNNVIAPVYIFYGGRDPLANVKDTERLLNVLPNLKWKKYIAQWGHYDYLMGIDAVQLVYVDTLRILRSISSPSID